MSVDFQQVRQQVIALGESAQRKAEQNSRLLEEALRLLRAHANNREVLRRKVERVVQAYDPHLRCALPLNETLDQGYPLPPLPEQATILAGTALRLPPAGTRHTNMLWST